MKCIKKMHPTSIPGEGFEKFAEALPCIVWVAEADGKVAWCNREFQRYTGRTLPETFAWGWIASAHSDDKQAIEKAYTHSFTTGTDLDSVVRLRNVEGLYRWFSVRARPFREASGAIRKWFGTLTDIHDRQMAYETTANVVNALMKGYFPKEFPSVKGLKFDALYEASNIMEKLGGDWYDTFALPDGRTGFSIGDVCGHGIDAAVKMGEAKQAVFVAACLDDPEPESVLRKANKVLHLRQKHILTTALYGIIDTRSRTVTYASAGHHPPMLAHPGRETIILPDHGFPLGVEENLLHCKTHVIPYDIGSMMLVYTDGLIEFNRDLFDGEARLLAAAAEAVRCKVEHPAKFIAEYVLRGELPNDDIAILTISFEDE